MKDSLRLCRRLLLPCFMCVCIVGLVGLQIAQADDLNPPPWRGAPLTTFSHWDFLTPNTPFPDGAPAPVIGNSGGAPTFTPGPNVTWEPGTDASGEWVGGPGGGTLTFQIPNWIDDLPVKLLQIQMTYFEIHNSGLTVSNINAVDPLGITLVQQTGTTTSTIPNGPHLGWEQRTEQWTILPNPDSETITVFLPAENLLTQIVIDTISVPEPSSLLLAGMGAALLGLTVWRRRARRA